MLSIFLDLIVLWLIKVRLQINFCLKEGLAEIIFIKFALLGED